MSTSPVHRTRRARRLAGRFLSCALVSAFLLDAKAAPPSGTVEGAVLGLKGPLVVFLDGARVAGRRPLEHEIVQVNRQFVPDQLVVGAGDRISFPNKDRVSHSVFSPSRSNKFDTGLYPPGANRSFVMAQPGVVDLFCEIHQEMHATISVVPSDHYALADASGSFRIGNVPPGKYAAVVWRKGKEVQRQPVEVEADRNAHIDITAGGPR
jgi:plastocyanin